MDLYSVLWVEKNATKDEIKKAYRKLAMKYHPDRTSGDKELEKKFKEINEAYATLWDDQKRQQYDMFGSTGWAAWGNPFGWGFSGWVDVDLGDIFESFFWGSNRRGTRRNEFKGEDLEYRIHIDLKTSIYGWKETIEFERMESCDTCKGEGGSGKKTCDTCGGSGQVTQTTQSIFGTIQQRSTCHQCQWSGESFKTICDTCWGHKRVKKDTQLEIEIPAGIDNGMIIKMTGEWNHGVGTKATWDLYIKFDVSLEEKWLSRDGVNLYYDLEIDVIEAILGTQKEVLIPILWKRTLDIKAGTQYGTTLKLSKDGVKHIHNDEHGDLFINITIKIPKKLSKPERSLYEEIAKEKKINVNKNGIFEKIFK